MPVSHIGLTVSHLPSSCSFFLSALQPLGYRFIGQQGNQIGLGIDGDADFFLCQETPGIKAGAAHIAFSAPDRITVRNFYTAALTAGARPHGSPATRDTENGVFNAAVLDTDGNSIEVVCRENEDPSDARSTHEYGRVLTWRQSVTSLDDTRSVYTVKSSTKSIPAIEAPKSATMSVPARSVAPSVAPSVARSQAPTLVRAHTAPAADPSVDANLMGDAGARKIIGTLIGAAAGAAVAYAMVKSEQDSGRKEAAAVATSQSGSHRALAFRAPSQRAPSEVASQSGYSPSAYEQQMVQYQREPSNYSESVYSSPQERRAIEAAPPRSTYAPSLASALRSGATSVQQSQAHRNFSDTESYYSASDYDNSRSVHSAASAAKKSYHSPTYVSVPNTRFEDAEYASTVGPRSAMRTMTAPSTISSMPSTIKAPSQAPSRAPSHSPSKAASQVSSRASSQMSSQVSSRASSQATSKAPSQAPSRASAREPSLISSFCADDDARSSATSHTSRSSRTEDSRTDYPPSIERRTSASSVHSHHSSAARSRAPSSAATKPSPSVASASHQSRSRAGSEAPSKAGSSSLIGSMLGRDRDALDDGASTVAPSDSISNAGSSRSRHSSRAYAPSDAGGSKVSRHSSRSKLQQEVEGADDARSRVSSRSHKSSRDVVHPDNVSEPSDASTVKPYKRKDSVVSLPSGGKSRAASVVEAAKRSVVSFGGGEMWKERHGMT
ncbi:uncharacterized protein K452DRAFT_145027 [Aplosporella prunicola CBS 121167]|uniref:VOC domain-containing protein n=1 Tax=Aplosporella prunicola CBS 121167 TaxID=1176127 RepID=A0A6A6BP68_9PEZI|nr:uncharacterized protein K452DRAFT_145027 [Aplosporella prunicola CBS 121167]KAF2144647.1 hypothetical protein K452DRAFT_145027 [Aplosporella prunicola CBS 121167]